MKTERKYTLQTHPLFSCACCLFCSSNLKSRRWKVYGCPNQLYILFTNNPSDLADKNLDKEDES